MNPWIAHVKKYAKEHGVTYLQALRDKGCKNAYTPKKGGSAVGPTATPTPTPKVGGGNKCGGKSRRGGRKSCRRTRRR